MTEEMEAWADRQWQKTSDYSNPPTNAEFWIRAFCEEVERRTSKAYGSTDVQLQGVVMDILRRELLGTVEP